ncbi:MAG: zinc-dependent alcohol dehydrogenase [Candidatus Dormibacteraceae bacterium]
MRLAVVSNPGVVEIREAAVPKLRPGQLLIETHISGISAGTELMVLDGTLPSVARGLVRYPLVPGYENVGRVVAAAPGVMGFREGGWVCSEGSPSFQGLQSCWGGHSEYVQVEGKEAFPLPAGMAPETAVFTVLASIALHGIQRGRVRIGETVAIFGQGAVGLLALQICRLAGAERLIAVDRLPSRLELARQAGADDTVLVEGGDEAAVARAADEIVRLTHGRGADLVVEVTGSPQVASAAVVACRERGRFLLLGMYPSPVRLDCWDLYTRELEILSSRGAGPKEDLPLAYEPWTWRRTYEESIRLLADGRLRVEGFVTHRFPPERIGDGYRALSKDPDHALKVVIEWR